jgi:hypothetical protein
MRRERERYRKHLQTELLDIIEALFFDGKKDYTLVQEFVAGRYHRFTKSEEHSVLVHEPGSVQYI